MDEDFDVYCEACGWEGMEEETIGCDRENDQCPMCHNTESLVHVL